MLSGLSGILMEREYNESLAYFSENYYPYFVKGFLLSEILIFSVLKNERGVRGEFHFLKYFISLLLQSQRSLR